MEDSIRKRLAHTLLTNGTGFLLSMLTAGIVPRSLGPRDYGSFQFLQTVFNDTKSMLNLSTSTAFFTWCSKHPESRLVILLYLTWEAVQAVLLTAGVLLAIGLGYAGKLWPDQPTPLLVAMVFFVLSTNILSQFTTFADSKALTVSAQRVKLVGNVVQVAAIVTLFATHRLNLTSFLITLFGVAIISLAVLARLLFRQRHRFLNQADDAGEPEKAAEIIRYFVHYCSPLVVFTLVAWAASYFDRWFLQVIGGSQEQAFYSLSFNWSQILLLMTISAMPIYWREVSLAWGRDDRPRVVLLYQRFLRMLFLMTCYFASFISCNAKFIVEMVAGRQFAGAALPFTLMCFYPVHQTYGQLNTTLLYAMERTRTYRNISLVGLCIGMGLTYFLLAPTSYAVPGLSLGALGLVLRMVLLQFIVVNVLTASNCAALGISWWKMLQHQALSVAVTWLVAWGATAGIRQACAALPLSATLNAWIGFLLAGMVYTAAIGVLVWAFPAMIGFERDELREYWAAVRRRFRRRA